MLRDRKTHRERGTARPGASLSHCVTRSRGGKMRFPASSSWFAEAAWFHPARRGHGGVRSAKCEAEPSMRAPLVKSPLHHRCFGHTPPEPSSHEPRGRRRRWSPRRQVHPHPSWPVVRVARGRLVDPPSIRAAMVAVTLSFVRLRRRTTAGARRSLSRAGGPSWRPGSAPSGAHQLRFDPPFRIE